jgi:hypothetical protein
VPHTPEEYARWGQDPIVDLSLQFYCCIRRLRTAARTLTRGKVSGADASVRRVSVGVAMGVPVVRWPIRDGRHTYAHQGIFRRVS